MTHNKSPLKPSGGMARPHCAMFLLTAIVWASMFAVDGQDVAAGLPSRPTAGPNQALAERMGVVMGTSHHEPMSRNQKEFNDFGTGEWDYSINKEFLDGFWRYGAMRAKNMETVFTIGMRGNGDLPLDGANVEVSRYTSVPFHVIQPVMLYSLSSRARVSGSIEAQFGH